MGLAHGRREEPTPGSIIRGKILREPALENMRMAVLVRKVVDVEGEKLGIVSPAKTYQEFCYLAADLAYKVRKELNFPRAENVGRMVTDMDEVKLFSVLRDGLYADRSASQMPHAPLTLLESVAGNAFNTHTSSILFSYTLELLGKRHDVMVLPSRVVLAGDYCTFETLAVNAGKGYSPRDETIASSAWHQIVSNTILLSQAYNIVGVKLAESDVHKAIDFLGHAIKLFPEDPDLWANRAILLNQAGRHGMALQSISRAVELNPRSKEYAGRREFIIRQMHPPVQG